MRYKEIAAFASTLVGIPFATILKDSTKSICGLV
jgi:hypothetical protein